MVRKVLIPFLLLLGSCSSPKVITNTRTVEVNTRDTIIKFDEVVVRDTVTISRDTLIYKDRVVVRVVNNEELSDSLRDVINALNLELEVICPDEEKTVQIQEETVVSNEQKIEDKPDFFERHWWKILLGLFVILVLSKIANKFV